MGVPNIAAYVDAIRGGKVRTFGWRKTVTPTTLSGGWLDLSVMPGVPPPQFYATPPLVATQLIGVPGSDGLPVGANLGGTYQRFIHEFLIQTPTAIAAPIPFLICDFLMYYPFIDQGTNAPQPMTNNVSLPRYTSGDGVQMLPVLIFPQSALADTFTVTYTNSAGVAGQVTPLITFNDMTYLGGAVTSATTTAIPGRLGAFLPLQGADTGVQSIQSVQMTNGTDVGLFAIVLVRPLVDTMLREATAPVEECFLRDRSLLVQFYDGAYLGLLCQPSSNIATTQFFGLITTAWV